MSLKKEKYKTKKGGTIICFEDFMNGEILFFLEDFSEDLTNARLQFYYTSSQLHTNFSGWISDGQ